VEAKTALSHLRRLEGINLKLRESQFYVATGRPDLALKAITELEKERPGCFHDAGHWQLKLEIYTSLSDKKNARKCLKFLKKFLPREEIKKHAKWIDESFDPQVARHFADENRPPARFLAGCGNPFCEKVESQPREFLVCSRCKRETYCGARCQRMHWKAGHKRNCSTKQKNEIN